MKRWRWLQTAELIAIHGELIAEFGGATGLRDLALLESAAVRPRQLLSYGAPSAFDLATAYAFGVARNHPFVDGNKRTAWVLARLFLRLNGVNLRFDQMDAIRIMLALAAGEVSMFQEKIAK